MLFQSSIRRELARSFGATLVVLITIVMTIVLIRTLGQASRGYINPQDVLLLMAYSALGRLPTILTLSLFIAMVGTLSRMYRDSEMVVWFTSGRSLSAFLKPLFRFAWPVLLIIALLSLFVWPWTNQQTQEMRERYENRGDLDRIAAGQFQESANGNRVFFIDREGTQGQKSSSNVFIASTENGKNAITTARSGQLETINGSQVLLLRNGQRLENQVGKSAIKISEFEEYGSNTADATPPTTDTTDTKLQSTRSLIGKPVLRNLGELAWRLGLALAPLNFVLSLTPTVLDDSSEMRRLVEVEAVRKAATRMSESDIDEFEAMLQAHAAVQNDYVGFLILDSRFHSRIYQLSSNVVLEQIATALYNIGLDHRRDLMSQPGEIAKSTLDHHAIVDALRTRDAVAATKAMETHLNHIADSSHKVLIRRQAVRPGQRR